MIRGANQISASQARFSESRSSHSRTWVRRIARDSAERDERVRHPVPRRRDPTGHDAEEDRDEALLLTTERAHMGEFGARELARPRGIREFGTSHAMDQDGREHEGDASGHARAEQPASPGEIDVRDLEGELGDQRIRRHPGEEDAGRDVGRVVRDQGEELADAFGGRTRLASRDLRRHCGPRGRRCRRRAQCPRG